ncbi:MAG TPA: hypothetical protein VHV79_10040 [Mycobacteriales bacterium]|jgi:hypothetical protein|nr:hypothetical protein [Mycobacteriales bacterium]
MSSGEADIRELASKRSSGGTATIETLPVVDVFGAGEVEQFVAKQQRDPRRTYAVGFQSRKRYHRATYTSNPTGPYSAPTTL